MKKNVFMLFDLDGVMINPKGYRRAFFETANYFLSQMGLDDLISLEGVPEQFEANGITCEWDMLPFTLLIVLDAMCEHFQINASELTTFQQLQNHLSNNKPPKINIEFPQKIKILGNLLTRKNSPSDEVLALQTSKWNGKVFKFLSGSPLIDLLLSNTRSMTTSITSSYFENLAIGSKKYRAISGQEKILDCPSYLETYDQMLVDKVWITYLSNAIRSGWLHASFMTARPTLPPVEITSINSGFFPEGEAAKSLTGLNIPLIGYGKLQYIGNQYGLLPDELLKPSPFQALAAIFSAFFHDELFSLEKAIQILYSPDKNQFANIIDKKFPKEFDLHIFEDSFIGIKSCEHAVEILKNYGFMISIYRWGISQEPEKRKQLEVRGAIVFNDINSAFSHIFKTSKIKDIT
jgi:hypothetical protein